MTLRENLPHLILVGSFALLAVWLGRAVAVGSPIIPLAVVGTLLVAFITVLRPNDALLIMVFSMLLSPEIKLAELPKRDVVVRIDDLLLMTIFFVWLVKTAVQKGLGLFVKTPLNRPILAYTLICIVSTAKGVIFGDVSAIKSSFYLLKYIEYFFLYILVSNLVTTRKHVRTYLWGGAITALIVSIFAYAHIGKTERLYAPFDDVSEGTTGESATLGGYLMLIMSVCLGFFTQAGTLMGSAMPLTFIVFMSVPFLLTLSRASYAGILFSALSVLLLGQRKRIALMAMFVATWFLLPLVAPRTYDKMMERIRFTFTPYTQVNVGGRQIGIETSAAQRINSWSYAFTEWLPKHPFLGAGITGVGLVDAQYPLVLGETGLIGFLAFAWLLWAIFFNTWKIFRQSVSPLDRGLSMGFLTAFVGLCVQSLTTNTFIIVRIMEPFWFLAALVMRLPVLPEENPAPSGEIPKARLEPLPVPPTGGAWPGAGRP